jgi:TPR repeat protein
MIFLEPENVWSKKLSITKLLLIVGLLAGMLIANSVAAENILKSNKALDAFKNGKYETALQLARPLAQEGDAVAQFILGKMHQKGKGIEKNISEAKKWFSRAAAQQFAYAQFELAKLYYDGVGILHDKVLAHMWYNLAGATGLEKGAEKRSRMESEMSQAQIEIAERMARSWIAIHQ